MYRADRANVYKHRKMSKKHYSDTEKRLFINLLKKYSHVIEIKKSDAGTLKNKEDAWNRIYEEYNGSSIISAKVYKLFYVYTTLLLFLIGNSIIIITENRETTKKNVGEHEMHTAREPHQRKTIEIGNRRWT